MTLQMDNVALVVDDLAGAIAFFGALGLELAGEATVSGAAVDELIALDGVRTDIALMRVPGGPGIELTRYRSPAALPGDPAVPPNTLGFQRVMFAVDDIEDVLSRLEPHGGALVGELVTYEDSHKLCYVRGPAGAVVALAQRL